MELKWLGTAGFAIRTNGQTTLIDPYLTRNEKARPQQALKADDFSDTNAILITHGHFDHLSDVPAIARISGATVYCSEKAAETLRKNRVPSEQIVPLSGETSFTLNGLSCTAFPSHHITFDLPLVWRTLVRARFNLPKYVPLGKDWPPGRVFSYRLEGEGITLHHFGSGGCTEKELENLSGHSLDILMVPLQGHSRICRIGARITRTLNPRMVIPHHQDDFYPPISQDVDIQPFLEEIKLDLPSVTIKILRINETWPVQLS